MPDGTSSSNHAAIYHDQQSRREPEPHQLNPRIRLYLCAIPLLAALILAPGALAEPPPAIPGADAAIAEAESALGSDRFGPYGCEAFVAFAYGVPQAKYGWDGASETMYQTLLAQGPIHTDMNAPRGALVFSRGSDGPHIDIARGDGTYISAGVQGLAPGYGDRHNIDALHCLSAVGQYRSPYSRSTRCTDARATRCGAAPLV